MRNYHKNLLASLLAAGVLCGTLPAAGAVQNPTLYYQKDGGDVTLRLSGVGKNDGVCSVQVELSGVQAEPVFQASGELVVLPEDGELSLDDVVYHTHKLVSDGSGTATYTLYINSKMLLNADGGALTLGTLTSDSDLALGGAAASLVLLDGSARELYRGGSGLREGVPSSGSGSDTEEKPGGDTDSSGSGSGSTGGSTSDKKDDEKADTAERRVSVASQTGGTVKVSPSRAKKGDTVTLNVSPDSGYVLSSLTVTDSRGREVTVRDRGDGKFTFVMPAYEVEIEAVFVPQGTASQPAQFAPLPFADVPAGEWYYSAAEFVYRHGMMSGTSSGAFSPHMPTSRAMIVSILHRLEGSPAAAPAAFPDVTAGQYYTDAVAWASANDIVSGYSNGRFQPNDGITREQLASILYRYAAQKGYDTTAAASLDGFTDTASVSRYAVDAMRWAVGKGLVSGTSAGALAPQAGASRAEAAAILMRFCQNLANMQ